MKNYLKNVRERLTKSSPAGFRIKALILALSFIQSYWVLIACAAALSRRLPCLVTKLTG
jgi:hypothetical protein